MRTLPASTVLLLALAALETYAQTPDRTGFGVHGGIGASVVRDEDAAETFRGNAFGFNLGLEYRFADVFGLSIGTFSLGRPSDTLSGVDTEFDVAGIDLLARVYFPISDKAEAFALIGGANYYVDIEPGGNNGLFGEEAWELGGGVDFYRSSQFSWRLEGRFFNGPRDESAGLLTIGFNYRF